MGKETLLSRAFVLAFCANFLHSLAFFSYLHLPGFLADAGASELMIGVVFGTMAPRPSRFARSWGSYSIVAVDGSSPGSAR